MGQDLVDLNAIVKDLIKTESLPKNGINVNAPTFDVALKLFIEVGEIFDMMKKNIFYGKEIDQEKMKEVINAMYHSAEGLKTLSEENDLTDTTELKLNPRYFHALIGMMTESTEIGEALQKYVETGKLDVVNVGEEIGDSCWYSSLFFDESEIEWKSVLLTIISKLKKRYPEKFTEEHAEKRDLQGEREILEGMIKKEKD